MGTELLAEIDDESLRRLRWLQEQRGGRLYVKVPLIDHAAWPEAAPIYLDGLLIEDHPDPGVATTSPAAADLEAHRVVAVVARGYADRTAFGLLLAARQLLARSHPALHALTCAALTSTAGHEPNIDWVYDRHGFEVVEVPEEVR